MRQRIAPPALSPLYDKAGSAVVSKMRVLAADDQFLLLLDLIDRLALHGVDAVPATSAGEALARLDATIDAVVTDIDMPGGMSGIDLAWQLSRTHPHLPVVVVSGGAQPPPGVLPPGAVFLPKPTQIHQLLAALCAPRPRRAA